MKGGKSWRVGFGAPRVPLRRIYGAYQVWTPTVLAPAVRRGVKPSSAPPPCAWSASTCPSPPCTSPPSTSSGQSSTPRAPEPQSHHAKAPWTRVGLRGPAAARRVLLPGPLRARVARGRKQAWRGAGREVWEEMSANKRHKPLPSIAAVMMVPAQPAGQGLPQQNHPQLRP